VTRGVAIAALALVACETVTSVGSDTGLPTGTTTDHAASEDSTTMTPSESTSSSAGTGGYEPPQECLALAVNAPYPDVCTPATDDPLCDVCTKLSCCATLMMCDAYTACACLLQCADTGLPADVCNDACAAMGGSCDLAGCGEVECAQACPG
jgi:hypothetical protein